MDIISLIKKVAKNSGLHNARCETIAESVLGLINHGNVQHHAITLDYESPGTDKAKAERLRRLLKDEKFDESCQSELIKNALFSPSKPTGKARPFTQQPQDGPLY